MMLAAQSGLAWASRRPATFVEYCQPSVRALHWSDLRRSRMASTEPYRRRKDVVPRQRDSTDPGRSGTRTPRNMAAWPTRRLESRQGLWSVASRPSSAALPMTPWRPIPTGSARCLEECYESVDYISLHQKSRQPEPRHAQLSSARSRRPAATSRQSAGAIDYRQGAQSAPKNDVLHLLRRVERLVSHRRRGGRPPTLERRGIGRRRPQLLEEDLQPRGCAVRRAACSTSSSAAPTACAIACIAQLVNVIAPIRAGARRARPGGRPRSIIHTGSPRFTAAATALAMWRSTRRPTIASVADDVSYLDVAGGATANRSDRRSDACSLLNRHLTESRRVGRSSLTGFGAGRRSPSISSWASWARLRTARAECVAESPGRDQVRAIRRRSWVSTRWKDIAGSSLPPLSCRMHALALQRRNSRRGRAREDGRRAADTNVQEKLRAGRRSSKAYAMEIRSAENSRCSSAPPGAASPRSLRMISRAGGNRRSGTDLPSKDTRRDRRRAGASASVAMVFPVLRALPTPDMSSTTWPFR